MVHARIYIEPCHVACWYPQVISIKYMRHSALGCLMYLILITIQHATEGATTITLILISWSYVQCAVRRPYAHTSSGMKTTRIPTHHASACQMVAASG